MPRCGVPGTTLMALVLDTGKVPTPVSGHVSRCLRCQARVARARRARHLLGRLPASRFEVSPGEHRPPRAVWAAAIVSGVALVLMARRAAASSQAR